MGNGGNGIRFTAPEAPDTSMLTVAYRATTPWVSGPSSSGPSANLFGARQPSVGEVDAWLREFAQRWVQMRIEARYSDYQNDLTSFVPRNIGGHKALSWSVNFTKKEEKWSEFLTLIYSEKAFALFGSSVPTANVEKVRPNVERMVETVRLP